MTSHGVTTGARMVAKRIDLCLIFVVDCPTHYAAGSRIRSMIGDSSIGRDFRGQASWSRSGVLLWGPILKREPQGNDDGPLCRVDRV